MVKDLREFQDAIAAAQMNEKSFIEVDARVFDYFTKKKAPKYFTYGQPGIRVYLEGTRDKIEKAERAIIY